MSIYEDMADMIRLGAYRPGNNPEVDEAILLYPRLMTFLAQEQYEQTSLLDAFRYLQGALKNETGPT